MAHIHNGVLSEEKNNDFIRFLVKSYPSQSFLILNSVVLLVIIDSSAEFNIFLPIFKLIFTFFIFDLLQLLMNWQNTALQWVSCSFLYLECTLPRAFSIVHLSSLFRWSQPKCLDLLLCCLVLINLIQTSVMWEKGPSIEEFPQPDIFLIND